MTKAFGSVKNITEVLSLGMGKNVKVGLFIQLNYVHEQAANEKELENKGQQ